MVSKGRRDRLAATQHARVPTNVSRERSLLGASPEFHKSIRADLGAIFLLGGIQRSREYIPEDRMKWMQMYLMGYVVVMCGLVAALWKLGVITRVGPAWAAIGIAIAIGLGIMMSVTSSGNKKTVEIDEKH
jgi:hypothetical protein